MGVWVGSAAACVRCNNVCGQTCVAAGLSLLPAVVPSGVAVGTRVELIDSADSIAAEDVDDAEEQAQADEEAEAAAAEALVETTLEMVDAKKCGLCYEWFEAEQMRWDAEPYCYVCKDDEACTARRPGARGRKRARREGSYASMSRGA